MAFFRYQFTDANGQLAEGTLYASNAQEAESALQQRGYPNAKLVRSSTKPPVVPVAIAHDPILANPAPAAVRPVDKPMAVRHDVVRTPKGSDKQRFFLFSQIAQQLKAGINPAQSFATIGGVTRALHYKRSLLDLHNAANNGYPIFQVMERYPDLYPEGTVGMIRAAEQGGFVPEAFEVLSKQAEEAYKFKRFHWFIWYLIPNAVCSIPLVYAFIATLKLTYKRSTEQGAPFLATFIELLRWPYGPATLAIAAVLLLLRWWLGSYPMRRFRHRLGLNVPIYGPRARNESVTLFSWTMGRLARGGTSPQQMWNLAADSVPNLEMRERLREAGSRMHSGSRLSEVIFGSKLFPEEYAPVISTGEMVGDLPGALDQLERVSRTEFDVSTGRARWGSARIGGVAFVLTSGIVAIVLFKGWYVDITNTILNDFRPPEEQVQE